MTKIAPGEFLSAGEQRLAPDGRTRLAMQSDGNLVIYAVAGGGALWATDTQNSGAVRAVMQSDGNFVLYSPVGAVWATGTDGHAGASLQLLAGGRLEVRGPDGEKLWQARLWLPAPVRSTAESTTFHVQQPASEDQQLAGSNGRQLDGSASVPQRDAQTRAKVWLWIGIGVLAVALGFLVVQNSDDAPSVSPTSVTEVLNAISGFVVAVAGLLTALTGYKKLREYPKERPREGPRD